METSTINMLGELTWEEAAERLRKNDIVLLPIGSLEQHGTHLPLDTDSYDAAYLARKAISRLKDPKPLILPSITYGVSSHHMDFAGTVTLSSKTLTNLVFEISSSLVKHGARKIVIINAHGGNTPALRIAAQRIKHELNLNAYLVQDIASKERKKLVQTKNDVHSGEYETSTSLANREELVRKDKIKRPQLKFPSKYLEFDYKNRVHTGFKVKEISNTGAIGDPTKASKEKGEKLWKAMIDNLVEFLEELRRM